MSDISKNKDIVTEPSSNQQPPNYEPTQDPPADGEASEPEPPKELKKKRRRNRHKKKEIMESTEPTTAENAGDATDEDSDEEGGVLLKNFAHIQTVPNIHRVLDDVDSSTALVIQESNPEAFDDLDAAMVLMQISRGSPIPFVPRPPRTAPSADDGVGDNSG
jgi:hypothetical protein